ncbi:uncharacterized protein LOC124328361 [Daphnia pulicaria]|uniref:uncharacterized protein LOC124328361 n=1 Tax=Daphnia pulicaria TaxID=35523 RepID=UPI001EECBA35|nr:uncharacterized protein LOC124328361 [Daphnia pulicaria]
MATTMTDTFTRHLIIVLVISSVMILQNSPVNSFPLPDAPFASSNVTPLLSTDAAQKREDDGLVLLVKDQSTAIAQQPVPPAQPSESPSKQVRILQPVDTVLENEIWQYRYPPFDNLFAPKEKGKSEEADDNEAAFSGRSTRLSTDALPSYVIGILDPAELVDGLFQQRPFPFGSNRNNQPNFNKRNSVSNPESDDQFTRASKSVSEQQRKIFGVPRIVLDSDDDRWVWQS